MSVDHPTWIAVAVVALTIASCTGLPVKTAVETRTISNTASIPTPVPCINAADVPVLPAQAVVNLTPGAATVDQLAAAIAANAENFTLYARAVNKILEQCVKAGAKKP